MHVLAKGKKLKKCTQTFPGGTGGGGGTWAMFGYRGAAEGMKT